ncbi:MAG: KGK domain-containing protein [Leptolyngbya sp. IPPAS B-1204]|nr:KGK domain-containing protein [Elainella sp. C42_A2020_010]RNJ66532.1 MAG: KGK domain-containing protein [Leptolyngbya sp. IPPAS B-1204]
MDNEYGLLGDDEVLFVRSGRIIVSNPTFKVSEFLDALAQLISEQEGEWSDEREGWFTDRGQTCEVLRLGNQGWQRGRVRIRLEFCPDRPPKLLRESSDLRSEKSTRDSEYRDDLFRDDVYTPRRSRETPFPADESYRWPGGGNEIYPEIDEDY